MTGLKCGRKECAFSVSQCVVSCMSEVREGCSGAVCHCSLVGVTPSLGFLVWEGAALCASTDPEGEEKANHLL